MAKRPPWKKANPRKTRGKSAKKLSPSQKATAKRRAKKAGRPYPNLVDNMQVASKGARKTTARKRNSKRATKRK